MSWEAQLACPSQGRHQRATAGLDRHQRWWNPDVPLLGHWCPVAEESLQVKGLSCDRDLLLGMCLLRAPFPGATPWIPQPTLPAAQGWPWGCRRAGQSPRLGGHPWSHTATPKVTAPTPGCNPQFPYFLRILCDGSAHLCTLILNPQPNCC